VPSRELYKKVAAGLFVSVFNACSVKIKAGESSIDESDDRFPRRRGQPRGRRAERARRRVRPDVQGYTTTQVFALGDDGQAASTNSMKGWATRLLQLR
jgi:hypothetical protein